MIEFERRAGDFDLCEEETKEGFLYGARVRGLYILVPDACNLPACGVLASECACVVCVWCVCVSARLHCCSPVERRPGRGDERVAPARPCVAASTSHREYSVCLPVETICREQRPLLSH